MSSKSVLTDSLGRSHDYLRISLTGKCNLNCSYCRPSGMKACRPEAEGVLDDSSLLNLVELLAGLGVRKVRLTGGEPLLRRGIESLMERIIGMPGIETLALTTNGTLLEPKLEALCAAGLQRLNVSLDSLDPVRLQQITGADCFGRVRRGIYAALERGSLVVKLNTVVIRGVNDDELADFVELTRELPLSVRFIEYMPFADNRWQPDKLVGWREMLARIEDRYSLQPQGRQGVARMFRAGGFAGSVGFIAPLTGCFCGECSRLRLTSGGRLRLCLHHPHELDLGAMLRSGSSRGEMEQAVLEALRQKSAAHGKLDDVEAAARACASMVSIGG